MNQSFFEKFRLELFALFLMSGPLYYYVYKYQGSYTRKQKIETLQYIVTFFAIAIGVITLIANFLA